MTLFKYVCRQWKLFPQRHSHAYAGVEETKKPKDKENSKVQVEAQQREKPKKKSQADYRKDLYKQFEECQQKYLQRIQTKGRPTVNFPKPANSSESTEDDLKTIRSPSLPQFTEKPTKLIKFGGSLGLQKTRFFLIDEENLIYYANQTDRIAKGFKALEGAEVQFEQRPDKNQPSQIPWHNMGEKFRVVLTLKDKKRPCFVYHNDKNFCTALVIKIKTISDPELFKRLKYHVNFVSQVSRLVAFRDFWNLSKAAYEEKVERIQAFQTFGKNLIAVADQNFNRNRFMLKTLHEMADNTVSVFGYGRGKLVSTFRTGTLGVGSEKDIRTHNISLILLRRLQHLIHMIKSRRQFRAENITKEITDLYTQEIKGTKALLALDIEDKNGDKANKSEKSVSISFQPHSPRSMLIENLEPHKQINDANFLTSQFSQQIDLDQISMIATDKPGYFGPIENEQNGLESAEDLKRPYTVKIYGACKEPVLDLDKNQNDVVEFDGLAPLKKDLSEAEKKIQIRVNKVQFQYGFIKRQRDKGDRNGFIRIQISQGSNSLDPVMLDQTVNPGFQMDEKRMYSIISEDFRLTIKDKSNDSYTRPEDMVDIDLPQEIVFTISPLLDHENEQLNFRVMFYANKSPIPSVIKDYMSNQVFKRDKSNARKTQEGVIQDLFDEENNKVSIFSRFEAQSPGPIDEREGVRLLVGRYCIVDQHNPHQVIKYNKADQTFTLRAIRSKDPKPDIPITRIQRIERYGVSVYDLHNLPDPIKASKFTFICKIKTNNRQFLTTLMTKIQDYQVKRIFVKRQQLEQKQSIARGHLICSIIQGQNLERSLQVQLNNKQEVFPRVKITLEKILPGHQPIPIQGDRKSTFESATFGKNSKYKRDPIKLLKNVTWTTADTPTGSIHDLGIFSKNLNPIKVSNDSAADIETKVHERRLGGRQSTLALNLQEARRPISIIQNQDSNNSFVDELNASQEEDMFGHIPKKTSKIESEDNTDQIYIRFQVYNASKKVDGKANQTLIGQSLIQANKLIDLNDMQKSTQLMLLLPANIVEKLLKDNKSTEGVTQDKMFAGTLFIQTLFVPDLETRWNFNMYESRSEIRDPEAMAHLNQLLNASLFDSYHYRVPTVTYNPESFNNNNYFARFNEQSRPRILVQKGQLRQHMQQMDEKYSGAEDEYRFDMKRELLSDSISKRFFANQEEIGDFFMYQESAIQDQRRPMMQEFSDQFIQRWLALTIQNGYQADKRKTRYIWHDVISTLKKKRKDGGYNGEFTTGNELGYTESPHDNDYDTPDDRLFKSMSGDSQDMRRGSIKSLVKSQFKAQNPSLVVDQDDQMVLNDSIRNTIHQRSTHKHNKEMEDEIVQENDLMELFKDRAFDNSNTKEYEDLHYCMHRGIPDELRVSIWKALLCSDRQTQVEIENFRNGYPTYKYDPKSNLYSNYLKMSQDFDCLAFKQIDEDVFKYETIDSYLQDCDTKYERDLILRMEKNSLRNLLRALILWSKETKLENGKHCIISYSTSMMDMIQRLNAITNSEHECFTILIGMIKAFPRPFAVQQSILLEKCENMMRYEMTALKTMVEHSLPLVYEKLQVIGLPIELLTYRSITSFYAADFSTEVVHRLWDIIIFWLSRVDPEMKKRGLWWLLSPSFLILQERADAICKATSSEEVIAIQKSGYGMQYDPQQFVEKIININQRIFEEGKVIEQGVIGRMFGKKTVENTVAQMFEDKRAENQSRLIGLFQQVVEENQLVDDLIYEANRYDDQDFISTSDFRKNFLRGIDNLQSPDKIDQFQRRSTFRQPSRLSNKMHSLAEVGESDVSPYTTDALALDKQIETRLFIDNMELKANFQVSKIHVCLHSYEMPAPRTDDNQLDLLTGHSFKVSYGKIDQGTRQFNVKECFDRQLNYDQDQGLQQVDLQAQFNYAPAHNFIQIELIDNMKLKTVFKMLMPILDLQFSRLTTRKILVLPLKGNDQFSQMHINVSFFIESDKNHAQESREHLERTLACFQRKRPPLVDVLHPDEKADYRTMSRNFKDFLQIEYDILEDLFSEDTRLDMMNETYNHFVGGDYGKISSDEFIELTQTLFPPAMQIYEDLKNIFETFTGEKVTAKGDYDREALVQKRQKQFRKPATIKVKEVVSKGNDKRFDFSLSKFFITCVLMSHSTVEEKLSLLYDTFVKVNGVSPTISPSMIVEMISIVFNRNLYYWPSHELYNQVEQVFTDGIGMVQGAFWTCDFEQFQSWVQEVKENAITKTQMEPTVTPEQFNFNDEHDPSEANTMDVTKEVQESITRYVSIFGTKIIDFNSDSSPFKELQDFVGKTKAASMLKMATTQGQDFKLVLQCKAECERFKFVLNYSKVTGKLLGNAVSDQSNFQDKSFGFDEIFTRNNNKLFLSSMEKPITKHEFLSKCENIPFFTTLIRVETFLRDKNLNTLKPKTKFLPVNITFFAQDQLFVFSFKDRGSSPVHEGNISVDQNSGCLLFNMNNLCKEDTLADARKRIATALLVAENAQRNGRNMGMKEQNLAMYGDVIGQRDFNILSKTDEPSSSYQWKLLSNDMIRFEQLGQSERIGNNMIQLKLESPRESRLIKLLFEQKSSASYDCLAVYRHADQSLDWLPCKIVKKILRDEIRDLIKPTIKELRNNEHEDIPFTMQCFDYEVSFLHLAQKQDAYNLSHNVFPCSAEDLLLSAKYTRELQLTFKQECLDYIRKTYNIKCNDLRLGPAAQYRGNRRRQNSSFGGRGNAAGRRGNMSMNRGGNDTTHLDDQQQSYNQRNRQAAGRNQSAAQDSANVTASMVQGQAGAVNNRLRGGRDQQQVSKKSEHDYDDDDHGISDEDDDTESLNAKLLSSTKQSANKKRQYK